MAVKTSKFDNRLSWRASQRAGVGLAKLAAVARAEANIDTLREEVLADVDLNMAIAARALGDGLAEEGAQDAIYEACNAVASTAGFFNLKALGDTALSVCQFLDAKKRDGPVGRTALAAHLACMDRLRRSPGISPPDQVARGLKMLTSKVEETDLGAADAEGLVQLVYASSSTVISSAFPDAVRNIVRRAADGNEARKVTGMLLAYGGWHLQCLEGSPGALGALIAALLFDPRHEQFAVLLVRPAGERRFRVPLCFRYLDKEGATLFGAATEGFRPQALEGEKAYRLLDAVERLIPA